MANINKNIIMQAGAAVANATNKAAGLSAATPEPGSMISAIQLVNGGRTIGPASLLHFTESVRNKLLSLLVTMEPIQDLHGYDSPWPAGGDKNIFDITQITNGSIGGLNYTVSNGIISYSGEATSNGWKACHQFKLPQTGTYHFHMDVTGDGGSFLEEFTDKGTDATIVCTDTNTVYRIAFVATTSGQSYSGTIKNIQIETGSTYSGFSPYSNICPITGRTGLSVYVSPTQDVADATTYAVDWTSEAGTVYGGTLDAVTGVLTVTHGYLSKNTADMNNSANYPGWTNSGVKALIGEGKNVRISDAVMNVGNILFANTIGTADILFLPTTNYGKTQSEWQALAMDVQMVIPLATPLTYQLTAQDIITLVGDNYIWSDSGDVTITE